MWLVSALSGDEDVGDYVFGLLECSPEYFNWILEMSQETKRLKKLNAWFYSISFWDYNLHVYRRLGDFDLENHVVEWGTFCWLSDDFDKRFSLDEEQATAASTIALTEDGAVWKGYPKHGPGRYETHRLLYADMQKLLDNLDTFELISDVRDLNEDQK